MFKTPILMLKMTFFWLLFRGKFEQKTQKSISFKNQWRLKNIKKAMVVKNIIAEDMPFTKSIFEQFWRSYCKKTIFVVFHFLKFLPKYIYHSLAEVAPSFPSNTRHHHWKDLRKSWVAWKVGSHGGCHSLSAAMGPATSPAAEVACREID